jgi:aspartate dehydrogenase
MRKTIGIAGLGAIGGAVAKALIQGIDGLELVCASEPNPPAWFKGDIVDFETLAARCDMVIEALPPKLVPELARAVFANDRDFMVVSSSSLIVYPEILAAHRAAQMNGSKGRIIVPSGALIAIDGVHALKQMGIKSAMIATTKPPKGYAGAPFVVENAIDLNSITEKTKLFGGYALEAAKAFPANVNVAATLSLAGIGADKTWVEVWADPAALGNSHEIRVIGGYSTITAKVENTPDPANPKSSMITAQSVISLLKNLHEPFAVF